MELHKLACSSLSLHAGPWAYIKFHGPKSWYFLTDFHTTLYFFWFSLPIWTFWPFPFKPPQLLPCRIQSRRPKFWTKFWTKFPQTSFTVNQDMNEVLNSHKRLAVYYFTWWPSNILGVPRNTLLVNWLRRITSAKQSVGEQIQESSSPFKALCTRPPNLNTG